MLLTIESHGNNPAARGNNDLSLQKNAEAVCNPQLRPLREGSGKASSKAMVAREVSRYKSAPMARTGMRR